MSVIFLKETLLLEWVNPMYLDISYQEQIQEEFEESSEIQLKDFLKVCLLSPFCIFSFLLVNAFFYHQEEKFAEVSVALRLHEIQWARRGPPHKRSAIFPPPTSYPYPFSRLSFHRMVSVP